MKVEVSFEFSAASNSNGGPNTMKGFWLNGYSGREERWAADGYRWVAAEPRNNEFALWGYQEDTPEVVYLGCDANEEALQKLADQFLSADQEIISGSLFS